MVNYPAKIDTSISIPSAVDNHTPVASSQYNKSRDAVIAIETELGVKPSSTYGTVRERLDHLESIISAGGGAQIAQDLGGTNFAPLVIGLYGNPLAPTSPTTNYVLTWTGITWEPKPPSIVGGLHNTLGGLQGGTSGEYYHLTSTEHVWLTDGVTTGYWDVTKGGTGLTSVSTGDIFFATAPNLLAGLTIGTDGYILTSSGGVPVWASDSSPTFHNNLNGLQGGSSTDGYYHLTSSQHTWLTDGYTDGYWVTTKGGTGLSTVSTGDLLYSSTPNTLNRLTIGSEGQILTVSSGIPIWTETLTHNNLSGLQGGSSADGYYHLTSSQHIWLTDGYANGYWSQNKGGTGFVSYSQGDILYADVGGNLTRLEVGTDNQVLTANSTLPTWADLPENITAHNDLINIQGGEADGYYHFTSSQHAWLTDGYIDGYWAAIKGGTGHTTYSLGDLLYGNVSNNLNILSIGSDGQVLKVVSGSIAWRDNSGVITEIDTENVGGGSGAIANITPTSGNYNTAFGYNAGNALTTGDNNIAIGHNALLTQTVCEKCIAIGKDALGSNADNNIAIGYKAGQNLRFSSESENTFIGNLAGTRLDRGAKNVAVGYNAIGGNGSGGSTTCNNNVAIGYNALNQAYSSDSNICIGSNSEKNIDTSGFNVCIGNESGIDQEDKNYSIFIGNYTRSSDNEYVTAIGSFSEINSDYSIAFGAHSKASHANALVIGADNSSGNILTQADNTAALWYHSLYLGKNAAEDIIIYAHNDFADLPYLKYDDTEEKWIGSNDGITTFELNSSDHNNLTDLQGGEADGYYHLTSGEHQFVIDGYNSGSFNDGYQLSINDSSIEWQPGYYHAIYVGKIGAVDTSEDGYLMPDGTINASEDFPIFVPAIQSTLTKMQVSMSQAPGVGESVTITLRKNGVDTAMTLTIEGASTSNSDLTTVVRPINAGDKLSLRVTTTSSSAVENLSVTVMVYPGNLII